MATVTKDFRIKSGLVVEGTNATVDGSDIITEDIITGGTQTNITVTYDAQTKKVNFVAENGVADSTTDDLDEGTTNKYFTPQRALDATASAYDPAGAAAQALADANDYTDSAVSAIPSAVLTISGDTGTDGVTLASDTLTFEGGTGIDIAVTNNKVAASIDNTVVTLSGNQTLSNKTVSDGITFNDGSNNSSVYVEGNNLSVAANNNLYLNTINGDIVLQPENAATVYGDTIITASASQTLTNKTIGDVLTFNDGSNNSTINVSGNDLDVTANNDLLLSSFSGDVVIRPDMVNQVGKAYIGSVSAGNQIATNSYVDNAVAGLDWKQAVNLLATSNVDISGEMAGTVIDGHDPFTGAANNHYRLLLTGQTDATENGIYYLQWDGNLLNSGLTAIRATDADTVAELKGAAVFVMEGTTYGGTSWVQNNHYANSFDDLVWTQFSGSGSVTAGTGITVNGLEVSIDRTSVDTWYEPAGAVDAHSDLTTGVHGVTGDVVGTTDSQDLSNKKFKGATYFQSAGGAGGTNNYIDVDNSTGKMTVESGYSLDLKSDGLVNIASAGSDIVLNADGNSYLWNTNSENQIATHGYVDNQTTDDVSEGSSNLYFTNQRAYDAVDGSSTINFVEVELNSIAKQVAATYTTSAGDNVVYDFPATYRSGKFLIKLARGTHTEVSEILLTLDTSNNVAITEYAIVGTNGSLGTVSAEYSDLLQLVRITVNTPSATNVKVIGTIIE